MHEQAASLKRWEAFDIQSPVKHTDAMKHDNRTMAACEGG